jgi:transcription elongation factor Elf1
MQEQTDAMAARDVKLSQIWEWTCPHCGNAEQNTPASSYGWAEDFCGNCNNIVNVSVALNFESGKDDGDGHCEVCGLKLEDFPESTHECPEGFRRTGDAG